MDNVENREIFVCGQCSACLGSQNKILEHLAQLACFTPVCPHCNVDFSGPVSNRIEYLKHVENYTKNIFKHGFINGKQTELPDDKLCRQLDALRQISPPPSISQPAVSIDPPLDGTNHKKSQEAFSTQSDCGISSLDQHLPSKEKIQQSNSAAPEKAETKDKFNNIKTDDYNPIFIAAAAQYSNTAAIASTTENIKAAETDDVKTGIEANVDNGENCDEPNIENLMEVVTTFEFTSNSKEILLSHIQDKHDKVKEPAACEIEVGPEQSINGLSTVVN